MLTYPVRRRAPETPASDERVVERMERGLRIRVHQNAYGISLDVSRSAAEAESDAMIVLTAIKHAMQIFVCIFLFVCIIVAVVKHDAQQCSCV